jgi:hypothetical protein
MENSLLSLIRKEINEVQISLKKLALSDETNLETELNSILRKRVANEIIQSPTLRAHAEAIILCLKKTKDYPLFSKYDFNDKMHAIYHTLDQEIRGFENTKQSSNAKESTFLRAKERLLRDVEKIFLSVNTEF